MRAFTATVILLSSLAASPQSRGAVNRLDVSPGPIAGNYRFAVSGTNPCSAVHMDFGDGSSHTYAIRGLPDTETVWHHFTRDGTFVIRATGANDCGGAASTRVTVVLPPDPRPARPTPAATPPAPPTIRFGPMDQNGDAVISRAEWRGSARSFEVHDWNGDGRLAGDELRFGAPLPSAAANRGTGLGRLRQVQVVDWSEPQFRQLDRNRDDRVSLAEWRFEVEDFRRVDRNRDNLLTLNEFQISDIDDDRGCRFVDLDLNGDRRIERGEWHGSLEIFRWLDRNDDGVLSRAEVVGDGSSGRGAAAVARPGRAGAESSIAVSARETWTDTGITVRAGDILVIRATGEIQFSNDTGDVAGPAGARGRRATNAAPLPDQNIGALIARVEGSPPFTVGGQTGTIRAPRAGRLYLGVNDDVLTDNHGEFRVTVITPPARP